MVSNGKTQNPDLANKEIENLVGTKIRKQYYRSKILNISYDFRKENYLTAIRKTKNYVEEGDIYIANMTQRLFLESNMEPYELYSALRLNNPAPFAAYMNYDAFKVVCASPERFIEVKDGTIVTRPIKGTRKREVQKKKTL